MKTYQVIIEQAMTIEAENEETAKRIAAECFDFGSADISANETESEARQWIAFDYGGQAYALGDCGDYDAAVEVAMDAMDTAPKSLQGHTGTSPWAFILSAAELQEILRAA